LSLNLRGVNAAVSHCRAEMTGGAKKPVTRACNTTCVRK
jgi:hypothetical protein